MKLFVVEEYVPSFMIVLQELQHRLGRLLGPTCLAHGARDAFCKDVGKVCMARMWEEGGELFRRGLHMSSK